MNSYFSTFITGFSDVVRETLKKQLPDIKIDLLLDGLIAYRTEADIPAIQKIPFFNNSFILYQSFKGLGDLPFGEMGDWIKTNQIIIPEGLEKTTNFKIIFSDQNLFAHMNKFLTEKLEQKICLDTGLSVDRQQGQTEIWLLARREKYGVIGLRITRHGDYEKILQKGELRPELTYLLSLLSEPSAEDIFLDPFAGSGAIPLQRASSFDFKEIIVIDNIPDTVIKLRDRLAGSKIKVLQADALHLTSIEDNYVNKIVTDPPWGLSVSRGTDIPQLYQKMLVEFNRILSDGGILVLLTSRLILMEEILVRSKAGFDLVKKIETLVNGQKATVYKYGHRN